MANAFGITLGEIQSWRCYLHLLQAVTARTEEQTEEVDLREFLDGDVDLIRRAVRMFLLLVFDRGPEVGIVLHGTVN